MTEPTSNEIEEQLREAGRQADHSTDGADSDSPPETFPSASSEPSLPDREAAPESSLPPASPDGAEPPPPPANPKPQPEPADSPYAQAKRAQSEREARAWKKIEAQKAEVKTEQERLAAERRQLEQARKIVEPGPVRDQRGFTAEDYERSAHTFESDGDDQLARQARHQAQLLRQAETQRQQQTRVRELHEAIQATVAARPEFADPTSAAGRAVIGVLDEFPLLRQLPSGFATAVSILDARKSASAVPDLQSKLDALHKENQRLKALTTLPSSNPRVAARERELGDLSPKEQERALRRLASEYDES